MSEPIDEHAHARHVAQRHLERLVLLSDGVFAIAVTLSAIEIKPERMPNQSLWQAWAMPLFVYFLSFMLVAQIWFIHRRAMSHLRDIDGPGTAINLLLLSLVALMPVVIRFALGGGSSNDLLLVYSLGLAVTYGCMTGLWGYLAFIAKLTPSVSKSTAWVWFYQTLFVTLLFGGTALYCAGFRVAIVGVVVLLLLVRWLSWRADRAAKKVASKID